MGSGESVRIRFVRCPSCRQILPEPTNVPVYQCANCGKLLRAKIRNTDATPTPGLHDADTAQNATLHNVSTEKECSSSTHAGSLNSSGECSSDQNDGGNQLFSQNGNSGELHAVNLLNEEKSDVSDQDADQLGALNQSNGNIKDVVDKHELESPSKLRDVNVFYEDINNGNDQTESSSSVIEQHGLCNDAGSSTELPPSENEELSQVAVAETEVTDAGSKAQAHTKSKFDYELRISNSDELTDEKETRLSSIPMHRLVTESISSDLVSSANEESEPIQENVQQGFNRVTSTDTFGAANVVNPGSELSGDLMDLSKSPISRSVRAYYDASVSSGEGTDDQFHGRHQHNSKSPYKASNYATSEERQKREKFHANRSSEIKDQFRNQDTNWGNSGECSSEQNDGGNQLFSQKGNSGELHAVNLLNEEKSDVSDQDADQLGALNQSNGNIKDVADKRELESPSSVKLRDVNVFYEDINNGNDQTESSCSVIEQHGVCHDAGSSTELPQSENEELSQVAVAETEVTEALAGSKAQAHMKSKFDYELRISRSDELIDEKETGLSSIPMHRLARESISSDLVSSANEESEPIQENVQQGFNRVTYTDTFGAANVVNHGSELSGDLMDLSKSPISRSVRAYYDDGVSSGEGTDDQFHGRHQHKSKSPYKASNNAASEERQKREKFHANRSSEINDQFRNQETNWGRFERDKYISRLQFHQRGFQTDYQSCNTSNPPLSAFRYNSSSHSHDQPVYSEHEKIKLLRMFYDLQDQLNKACFVNEKTNGRSPAVDNWKDHHVPMYYGREAFEEDFHNYSGYPGNFMEGSNWPQQGTHLHMPFRGEATFSRHQIDYSMRCCPQVKRYSAQLPLAGCHSTNDFRKVPSGINFSSSHGSCPKSPQCHEDSEFPMYYRGTLSDDKRHQENAAKNYVREKYYPGKRHLRPVAGGAPFITCPSCFKQLQLPAYFLLFERRCHRVQCGACSELLKFSLVDGIHLVPYTPSVEAPPPSGIDEYSEAGNVRPFTPAFHGHHSSEADHVSCSNDCWVSRRKNCSTERDANFQTTERNESYASLEDRKELASGGRHKIYGIGSTCASPGRRSGMSKGKKVYSESEELRKDGGSPLHRLMGYYSASELIYNLESCSSSSWGTY